MKKNLTSAKNGLIGKTLLLVIFFLISCNNDDSDNTKSGELTNDIENQDYVRIIEKDIPNLPINTQIAIALVHNGTAEYIGITNKNNVLRGVNNADKIFEIGSITKVFTGICLSKMVVTNEVSLTETLQEQFNFSIPKGGDITLQQLANHTSGLPKLPTNADDIVDFDLKNPYANYSFEKLKNYLQNHVNLNSVSGTDYLYSNLGVGILGYSLSQKRNTTYEKLLKDIIFNPLNMDNTTTLLGNVDVSKLVEPRDINGNIVSHWDFSETTTAAGSIKSSVKDMSKFMFKNFEKDDVYNLAQKKTFNLGNNYSMGLCWNIYKDEGFNALTHNGGTGGFSSMLMLDKEKQTAVLVLSNVEGYNDTIEELCNSLFLKINE